MTASKNVQNLLAVYFLSLWLTPTEIHFSRIQNPIRRAQHRKICLHAALAQREESGDQQQDQCRPKIMNAGFSKLLLHVPPFPFTFLIMYSL